MKADVPPKAGRNVTVDSKAVVYRPDPSGWILVAITVLSIVFGVWVWCLPTQRQDVGDLGGDLVVLWMFVPAVLWSGHKRLVITRDDHLQCLRLELCRWPLASQVVTYPIADVRDAEVELDKMGETLTHRVVLVLNSGDHVPLTMSFCSGGHRHERAVREIRALLNRASASERRHRRDTPA